MRSFKLIINGKAVIDATKGQNYPELEADIDGNSGDLSVGSKVTIMNFTSYQSIIANQKQVSDFTGKSIELWAGYRDEAAFGVTPKGRFGLIMAGTITSPHFEIQGTSVHLVFFCYPIFNEDPISFEVQGGTPVWPAIQNALAKTGIKVEIDPSVLTITAKSSYQGSFTTYLAFLRALKDQFKITSLWKGTALKFYNESQAGLSFVIKSETLIGQPSIQTIGSIVLTTLLYPSITIGSTITLNTVSFSYAGFAELANAQTKALKLIANGDYIVSKVQHVMRSRNTAPESWCTRLWATSLNEQGQIQS